MTDKLTLGRDVLASDVKKVTDTLRRHAECGNIYLLFSQREALNRLEKVLDAEKPNAKWAEDVRNLRRERVAAALREALYPLSLSHESGLTLSKVSLNEVGAYILADAAITAMKEALR